MNIQTSHVLGFLSIHVPPPPPPPIFPHTQGSKPSFGDRERLICNFMYIYMIKNIEVPINKLKSRKFPDMSAKRNKFKLKKTTQKKKREKGGEKSFVVLAHSGKRTPSPVRPLLSSSFDNLMVVCTK